MTAGSGTRQRVLVTAALLMTIGLLVGCAGRGSPPLEYFSLNTVESISEPIALPIRVSRVRVPEYIDNDRIWVREQDQRMLSIPGVRWSEPLAPAITREIRIALGSSLTDDRSLPNLVVDIERLEALWMDDQKQVILRARWQLEGNPSLGTRVWEDNRQLKDREAEAIALAKADLLRAFRSEIRRELSTTLSLARGR